MRYNLRKLDHDIIQMTHGEHESFFKLGFFQQFLVRCILQKGLR